jgi:hypothetical protein
MAHIPKCHLLSNLFKELLVYKSSYEIRFNLVLNTLNLLTMKYQIKALSLGCLLIIVVEAL